MIGRFREQLNDRQISVLTLGGLILLAVGLIHYLILPSYTNMQMLRSTLRKDRNRSDLLMRNLQAKDSVEAQFVQVESAVLQTETDEITISQFLREIEALARKSNMTLVNMKPMAPKAEGTLRRYEVKLSIAGTLQDVFRFVHELTNGDRIVGLHSMSLRGVQGGRLVECNMEVWAVRMIPGGRRSSASSSKTSKGGA